MGRTKIKGIEKIEVCADKVSIIPSRLKHFYLIVFIFFIIISLSLAAYKRNALWRNDIGLWEDVVKKNLIKARVRTNLGNAYYYQGQMDKAAQEYLHTVRLEPNLALAHHNVGFAYYNQGRLDEAIQEYQTAIKLKPDYAKAYYNLGVAYYNQGNLNKAIEEYQTAIRLKPDYPEAYNNLGNVYAGQGQLDMAIKEYEMALKLKPDFPAAQQAIQSLGK